MLGRLAHIHVVPRRRAAPEPLSEALLALGRGVPGDHHDRPGQPRPITLIGEELLDEVARALGRPIGPGASRRNLTVAGLAVDTLGAGTVLAIGTARLQVVGPCAPCRRMEEALGPGALGVLRGRGGLVVRVVAAGTIRPGDAVQVVGAARSPGPAARLVTAVARLRGWVQGRRTGRRDGTSA